MNNREQLIENCNKHKVTSMQRYVSGVSPLMLGDKLYLDETEMNFQEMKEYSKEWFDFFNDFFLKVNLQIYDELISRGLNFKVIDDYWEAPSRKLDNHINDTEISCYTDDEIKENLTIPIIDELIEALKGRDFKVFMFVVPWPLNLVTNEYPLITKVKAEDHE